MTAPEARILVVDDEPNIVELLSVSLRFAGFDVRTAVDGASALGAVRSFGPDLLVLDVMMPGLDGFDVLADARGAQLTERVTSLVEREGLGRGGHGHRDAPPAAPEQESTTPTPSPTA